MNWFKKKEELRVPPVPPDEVKRIEHYWSYKWRCPNCYILVERYVPGQSDKDVGVESHLIFEMRKMKVCAKCGKPFSPRFRIGRTVIIETKYWPPYDGQWPYDTPERWLDQGHKTRYKWELDWLDPETGKITKDPNDPNTTDAAA